MHIPIVHAPDFDGSLCETNDYHGLLPPLAEPPRTSPPVSSPELRAMVWIFSRFELPPPISQTFLRLSPLASTLNL